MASKIETVTYREARRRLLALGFLEEGGRVPGATVFYRALMGVGQPFQAIPNRGDDGPVYPEEIEEFLRVMGTHVDDWCALEE